MRTFYFYSVPTSKTPSPYYLRFAAMLKDISRKGIFHFKLWQGSHDAPVPIEPVSDTDSPQEGGRATGEA